MPGERNLHYSGRNELINNSLKIEILYYDLAKHIPGFVRMSPFREVNLDTYNLHKTVVRSSCPENGISVQDYMGKILVLPPLQV